MVFRKLLVALLVLATPAAIHGEDLFRVVGRIITDGLRVREGPVLNAEVVDSLYYDTRVEILDLTTDRMQIGEMDARWYHVRTVGPWETIDGWCYGYFVEVKAINLLTRAISLNRDQLVMDMVEEGVDINTWAIDDGVEFTDAYEYRVTPLIQAIRMGRRELVRFFLAKGADPNIQSSYGDPGGGGSSSALIAAVERGAADMIPMLVAAGADLEAETRMMGGGGEGNKKTPLIVAVTLEEYSMAETLIGSGADVNHAVEYISAMYGDSWKSPLDIAETLGNDQMVRLLRSHGAENTVR
ncbi:MAG: SH3 domain-containing protein [Spirochaetia bacterium]